ncbi:MAG TPA: peptidase T, partial [Bacteroidetes bacterium]|nr:peptidase T [Bacteroidota bacterium]
MNESALTKFIRYAMIDTQSSEDSQTYPSTAKQFDLLKLLVQELRTLGLKDVEIDQYGYVMATVPSNLPKTDKAYGKVPTIGFIAHVDTSPSTSGANVKPQVIESYKGGDIVLPGDNTVVLRVSENPELASNIGKTIVTTDGTTLLGADDKAGVSIIMSAVQKLMNTPSVLHGDLRVAFTPDEEIGAGTKHFDIKKFGAQFAYTVDGDTPGELNKETFSADLATITVHGRNIHPGSAKNIMVNSIRAMADIIVRMPKETAPETTEGYEPYIHPHHLVGEEAKTTLKILLRDFETPGLGVLKKKLEAIIADVQPLHPKARIELSVLNQYRNMRDYMVNDPRVLDCMFEATRRSGLEPKWVPIRGGTDGSRLTEKGLPTPNIFTGGQNYHGKTEWLSVYGMEKSVETLVNLAQVWADKCR